MPTLEPPHEGVPTPPKHRRCTRRRHHVWGSPRGTLGTGWSIVRCLMCGEAELT